ncbi:MAG: ABC transporter permease subunit [Proteobacteria bacterium]|nr:ABC transporter permease subunit [Pseudomonadota bacterium]
MMAYRWNFAAVFENWEALAIGAAGTLRLFVICLVLGLSLGFVIALLRRSPLSPVLCFAVGFIEFFRNTPVLVQILWFYFALPMLVHIELSPMMAATLGISLNSAAYSSEIYRAGIQSIEPGQWEAARAIGMRPGQIMRRIIMPQAIRRVLPALTNRGIEIFKMTTLASVVAYVELLTQGKLIASLNFNPLETYTVIGALFFVMLYPMVLESFRDELRRRQQSLLETLPHADGYISSLREVQFHSTVYEACGHHLLHDIWRRLAGRLQLYLALHQSAHERTGPLRDAHDDYVRLALGDDLDAMIMEIESHMRRGVGRLEGFLNQRPSPL